MSRRVDVPRDRAVEVLVYVLALTLMVVVVVGSHLVVWDGMAREEELRMRRARKSSVPVLHQGQITTASRVVEQPRLYEITAYSHGCILPRAGKEGPARRAANGRWPIADITVAADTRLHPFGAEVLIEGVGFRVVGDRGHTIKGRRLDLFVDTCKEARAWGRRWVAVHVIPRSSRWSAE